MTWVKKIRALTRLFGVRRVGKIWKEDSNCPTQNKKMYSGLYG